MVVALFLNDAYVASTSVSCHVCSIDATEDDIRRAYRKIVLKHHPDKRKAQGEEIKSDDDYFTCITKAYETLSKYLSAVRKRMRPCFYFIFI